MDADVIAEPAMELVRAAHEEVDQERVAEGALPEGHLAQHLGRRRHGDIALHQLLALHLEGERHVLTTQLADLSRLDRQAFWTFLDNRGWMHPFDADGVRQPRSELPKTVAELEDDPYRSLAGELRFAGGYAKDATPFSEFLWADALRRRVEEKTAKNDPETALEQALAFAKSSTASYLPGWCGPHQRS